MNRARIERRLWRVPGRKVRPRLLDYMKVGGGGAVVLCLVAVLGVGIAAIAASLGADIGMGTGRDLMIGLLAIFLSYAVLGVAGATALWLLRALQGSLIAWMIRGAVLGPIVYGVVGLTSVILYVHTGVNMMDYRSPEEAWQFLWGSLLVFAVLGAVVAGPILYMQSRRWEDRPKRPGISSDE